MSALSVLAAAREEPHRTAISFQRQDITFAELGMRVTVACEWLEQRGVGPGARVAVVPRNDVATLTLLYALFELGATAVMIHPRLVPVEREVLLARATPALFVEDATSVLGDAHASRLRAVGPAIDETAPLAILFTSGTSGEPKGAVLSRGAFLAAAAASAANLGWRDDDRWLLCMPLAHVGGLSIVTRCLIARRSLVLASRFDAANVAAMLGEERITLLSVVPTMLHKLMENPAWQPPPALRAVLLGGAAATDDLIAEAGRRRVPTLTTYGLTEACSQVTTQRYGTPPDVSAGSGAPVLGVDVRIVDGEIQVRGPSVMSGYFGLEKQPFTDDGWLRTGDLGRLDERGHLHIDGRRSDLIVTGGENVYPAEVEMAVLKVPGVSAACVFGVPDSVWGQIVAVAIVARDPSAPPSADDLDAEFAKLLAPHKRPRRHVVVDEIPMTASGKLRRAEAQRLFCERVRPLRER